MERIGCSDGTSPCSDRSLDMDQSQGPRNVPQTIGSYQPPIRTSSDFVNGEQSSNMVPKTSSESDDANESCSYRSNGSSGGDSSPSEQNEPDTSHAQVSPKRSKSGKRKRDRSKLRKGKWTSEEEEYTSRIIHYFSTGLLTLPEGSTLRSYLADKLNCDPMRITKKYAGASCLGRRVYHFRDRVHPSIAEIQVAKVELDHLEQRFRLRVEGGHPSAIAPPPVDQPQLTSTAPVLPPPAVQSPENLLQSLLLGLSAFQQNSALPTPPQAAVAPVPAPFANSIAPTGTPAIPPILAQLLLASAAGNNAFGASQNQVPLNTTAQAPGVDPNVASWAFTQVAAALGPALSQLAAANIKQMQQQQQQAQIQAQQQQAEQLLAHQKAQLQSRIHEQQNIIQQKLLHLQNQGQAMSLPIPEQGKQPGLPQPILDQPSQSQFRELLSPQSERSSEDLGQPLPRHDQPLQRQGHTLLQTEQLPRVEQKMPSRVEQSIQSTRTFQEEKSKVFASEFKQAYERHLRSLGIEAAPDADNAERASPQSIQRNEPTNIVGVTTATLSQANVQSIPETVDTNEVRRTEEDEEGGTALLGFLSSLRKSYENVLREKQISESSKSELSYNATRAATVTDSNSSQQRDSSVEDSDWNSDKKTDNSSSEDSEKEEGSDDKVKNASVYHNQGPPRKRMKVKRVADVIRKGPSS